MNKFLTTLLILFTFANHKLANASPSNNSAAPDSVKTIESTETMYCQCGLEGLISLTTFEKAMAGYNKYDHTKPILAICDFSKPSTQERFFVIDLEQKKVLIHSLVAHGKNSGDLMATRFSNVNGSLQSSLGFYRVGSPIHAPKHGLSLLLDGLEQGVNDNARTREIIIHGAFYVSQKFINQYGVLGKSWGCPALPDAIIPQTVDILKDGALLFISN